MFGREKKMEELKEAIIEPETNKIKCPVCGKTNGMITTGAFVRGIESDVRVPDGTMSIILF